MPNYRLWECDEDRWSHHQKDLASEEEAIAWMDEIVQADYKWQDEYSQRLSVKYNEPVKSRTIWYKRNYPNGHYTLFAYIKGEEPAV